MERSVINPNKYQNFVVQICDDPNNPIRKMGFYTDDVFIPLVMYGSVATLTARTPTL